jgi:CheY-like chemotaxis protein
VKEFEPQIAVLDLGLPRMDGYELGRRIRCVAESTRLIALSGYGQVADTQRSRAAGFDAHLVKPVDLEALQVAFGEIATFGEMSS